MPYKRTYRKKTYRKKPASTNYVRKVARIEASRMINKQAEHKFGETPNMYLSQVDYSGTSMIWPCFPTLQGGGDQNYIGTQVKPTWITFRGFVEAGDTFDHVRIIVVQWNKGNGDFGDIRDILQFTGNVKAPFSPYNVDQKHRFRVLYDKTLSVQSDTASGRIIAPIHFNIKTKQLKKIVYKDGAGTIETGGIYMYAVSDSAVAPHPLLTGSGRTYFVDF